LFIPHEEVVEGKEVGEAERKGFKLKDVMGKLFEECKKLLVC
jgi:hypothetical protein